VEENDDEEDRVEVGNDGSATDDGTPCERHDPVGNVVGLAAICPEAAGKEAVSVLGLDVRRVLDGVPGELGEGLAEGGDPLRLHFEMALLGHCSVPDVVGGEDGCVNEDILSGGELIFGRIVRSHVDNRVDVGLSPKCK